MNQKLSDGTKPMIVFAVVTQNYKPVINAEVWATLEPESGPPQILQLLDNGAGKLPIILVYSMHTTSDLHYIARSSQINPVLFYRG